MASKALKLHYKQDWNFKEIKTGDSISLGKRELSFITTPMVHWPDNQVTYCPQEKILFSNDAFGQHIASSERFASELPMGIVMEEAKKYYANIVLPYSKQVQKVLDLAAHLAIDMICPSHGVIWTPDNIGEILAGYKAWAYNVSDNHRALVIYDSMWKSTQMMAEAIHETFEKLGVRAKLLSLQHNHISDIMTDIIDAKFIAVGSPTLNSSILPTVAAFLYYLKGLSPRIASDWHLVLMVGEARASRFYTSFWEIPKNAGSICWNRSNINTSQAGRFGKPENIFRKIIKAKLEEQ
jgi:flavorubredoxin